MASSTSLKHGILGKKQGDFRIAFNTASRDFERCNVCEGNAGRLVEGSRKPLEIFSPTGIVCPGCSHSYAPEGAKILDEYYASR